MKLFVKNCLCDGCKVDIYTFPRKNEYYESFKLLTHKQCADFLGISKSAFSQRRDRIYYQIAITVIVASGADKIKINKIPRKDKKE